LNRKCEVIDLHLANPIPTECERLRKVRFDISNKLLAKDLIIKENHDFVFIWLPMMMDKRARIET